MFNNLQLYEVILSAIAIAVAVWLFYRSRNTKDIRYAIVGSTPIANVPETLPAGRLQILFDGSRVSNPYLTVVELRNTGRLPIVPDDFHEPIAIKVGEEVRILAVSKLESKPEDLKPGYEIQDDNVTLVPLLLNGGDSIKTSILTDGKTQMAVRGRIAGISRIQQYRTSDTRRFFQILLGSLVVAGLTFPLLLQLPTVGEIVVPPVIAFISIFIFAFIVLYAGLTPSEDSHN